MQTPFLHLFLVGACVFSTLSYSANAVHTAVVKDHNLESTAELPLFSKTYSEDVRFGEPGRALKMQGTSKSI